MNSKQTKGDYNFRCSIHDFYLVGSEINRCNRFTLVSFTFTIIFFRHSLVLVILDELAEYFRVESVGL